MVSPASTGEPVMIPFGSGCTWVIHRNSPVLVASPALRLRWRGAGIAPPFELGPHVEVACAPRDQRLNAVTYRGYGKSSERATADRSAEALCACHRPRRARRQLRRRVHGGPGG